MGDTVVSNGRTFKRVGGASSESEKPLRFVRPSELANDGITGLILEGVYVGPVQSNLDETKLDYKFETDDEIVIINGNGSLSYRMSQVPEGTLVQIIYNGKSKIKSGKMAGREAHSFDVLAAVE